ncbi:hypothetical protein ACFYVR_08630 [Rhodococcus sp. NPDC003318]|uniref:hypothetical protein n=1 Tax=Rhodococcus sp. NPDC003318 TaxID=3364503 RepID=UPI003673AD5A
MQVLKHSWEHTAVQWTETARGTCREIHDWTGREGRPGAPAMRCEALTATIERAAHEGRIAITNEEPVPKPQLAH